MVIGRVVVAVVLLYAAIERQQGWAQWVLWACVFLAMEVMSVMITLIRRDMARVVPDMTHVELSNDALRELLDLAESTSVRDWSRDNGRIVKTFNHQVIMQKTPTMSANDFEFMAACSPRRIATMARLILKARGVEV